MKTFHFIQEVISYNLKDPHSKALESDCLFPSAFNYDTVSLGRGWGEGCLGHLEPVLGICLEFGICDLKFEDKHLFVFYP